MELIIKLIVLLLFVQYICVLGGGYAIEYIKSLFITDTNKRKSIYK